MSRVFALVDCNNFYASCERVFNPKIANKPIIVLSNNDGIVVARSNEVKSLGIRMGAAVFEIEDLIKKHDITVFSSNYTLYADMSDRIMETLSTFTPEMEVYSIDEAFLDLAGIKGSLTDYSQKIRNTVKQWTGVPVSIGIAKTKTLAKIANYIAKRSEKAKGVLDLTDSPYMDKVLAQVPAEKIWGIGSRTAAKLKHLGINTALDLSRADAEMVRDKFGVVYARVVCELQGACCYDLEQNPPAKKSLAVSRMFGRPVESLEQLKEAAANYAARAGEKLREENFAASLLTVYVITSMFIKNAYYNSQTVEFQTPTTNTTELISSAQLCVEKLYRKGCKFKKCGIVLNGLVQQDNIQQNLFDTRDRQKTKRLMEVIDKINSSTAPGIFWAAEGIRQPWRVKFKKRSKHYTTDWNHLPEAV